MKQNPKPWFVSHNSHLSPTYLSHSATTSTHNTPLLLRKHPLRVSPALYPHSWPRIPFHPWMCGLLPTTRIPTATTATGRAAQRKAATTAANLPSWSGSLWLVLLCTENTKSESRVACQAEKTRHGPCMHHSEHAAPHEASITFCTRSCHRGHQHLHNQSNHRTTPHPTPHTRTDRTHTLGLTG